MQKYHTWGRTSTRCPTKTQFLNCKTAIPKATIIAFLRQPWLAHTLWSKLKWCSQCCGLLCLGMQRFFKIWRSRGGHDFHITVLKWKEELGLFGVSLDQTCPIAGLETRGGAANLSLDSAQRHLEPNNKDKIKCKHRQIQIQTLAIVVLLI